MALIECPDCGHDVSDSAACCPNCGFPIQKQKENFDSDTLSNKKSRFPAWIIATVLLLVILIGCFFVFRSPDASENDDLPRVLSFEQEDGTLFLDDNSKIKNKYLTEAQTALIDTAMRSCVRLCNDLNNLPPDGKVDFTTFGSDVMEIAENDLLKASDVIDPELNRSPVVPIQTLSGWITASVLSAALESFDLDSSSQSNQVSLSPDNIAQIRTCTINALEYYYNENPKPYLGG